MSIEEQIKQIEDKFPEIKGRLSKYCGHYERDYWEGQVKEVTYKETKTYQMVYASWEELFRDSDEGRLRVFEWTTLYFKDKSDTRDSILRGIQEISTEQIEK